MTPAGLHLIYVAQCREPQPNKEHSKGKFDGKFGDLFGKKD